MKNGARCIAIVDDEQFQRELLDAALRLAGYDTLLCGSGIEAIEMAAHCDLMILDTCPVWQDRNTGARQGKALPSVILLTAFIDVQDAVASRPAPGLPETH